MSAAPRLVAYLVLLRIQDDHARSFYEIEAARESWSVRELRSREGDHSRVAASLAPRRNGSGLLRVEGDSDLVVVRADAGQARLSCRKRHETERDLACTRR